MPTLLVLGGGTGAMAINNLIKNNLEKLIEFCQIIHITGKNKSIKNISNSKYHNFEFLQNTFEAYAISDAVVSRCGIGTLSELSAFKKPSILIPIPWVTQNEQVKNAKVLVDCGLGHIVPEGEVTAEHLFEEIKVFWKKQQQLNNKERTKIKQKSNKIFIQDGTEKVLREIEKNLREIQL